MSAMLETETGQTRTKEAQKKPRSLSNLAKRLVTALVVLPLIIIIILWGSWPFMITISLIAALATVEFYFMERSRGLQNNTWIGILVALAVLFAFQLKEPLLWQVAISSGILITFGLEFGKSRDLQRSIIRVGTTFGGTLYIAFPFAFLISIRQIHPFGIHWIFAIIYSTWCTDTFSYLVGNMFGKNKLAPRISPNKTIEGAIGGILGGAIFPMFVLMRIDALTTGSIILLIICPFIAIIGDLFESSLKRYFGVKDSHLPGFNIFPGHGGGLDRVDSLLWVVTAFYIYLLLVGQVNFIF